MAKESPDSDAMVEMADDIAEVEEQCLHSDVIGP
jgi:hypothetical protein